MREILKISFILTAICLVVTAALAVTNYVTKDTIVQRNESVAQEKRQVVLKADKYVKDDAAMEKAKADPKYKGITDIYKAETASGEVAGYVVSTASQGYGGLVNLMVGIDKTGKITGVDFGDMKETPGLGTKVKETKFISQFKDLKPAGVLKVVKSAKTAPEQIEAVSGATISSRAVTNAVQEALDLTAGLK